MSVGSLKRLLLFVNIAALLGLSGTAYGFWSHRRALQEQRKWPDFTIAPTRGTGAADVGKIGRLSATAPNTMTVDGTITSDGLNGSGAHAAGGAGGSIWVTTDTLTGSGKFSADGGDSSDINGGGGGGDGYSVYGGGGGVISPGGTDP